jgi:hypothetical protein
MYFFGKTSYFNIFSHFPVLPCQCRLRSVEWGGVQSVECEDSEDSGELSGECNAKGMKWGLWSVKCRVVKCKA